jgi:His/Glu/Gln/Arg/opine family amino acid ABC transporter permease subunit
VETLIAYLPLLARGALVTASLAVLSLALATALGGLGAAARIGGGPVARQVVLAYTTIIRGVPDLVLLLLIYFGGQRLLNTIAGGIGLGPVSLSTFWAGVFTLGFIYGAYLTETFRGAYMTVPRGQTEAARALGLGTIPRIFRVVLPQLVRFALPGYANVWQVLVKSTAVVSVIGLADLVGYASDAGRTTREPFLFYTAVLGFYLLITWVSTTIFEAMERRYAQVGANAR